jgi:hypothetical protein
MTPARSDERALLSTDTSRDAERRQIAVWQSLSTVEIAALIDGASRAARTLALAGLRVRHPNASDKELVARFAEMTIGPDLARLAYPELDGLER